MVLGGCWAGRWAGVVRGCRVGVERPPAAWRGHPLLTAYCLLLTTYHSLLTTYLLDEGHEVVGDALGVLSDLPTLVRAHRVEVSQQHDVPRAVRPGEGKPRGKRAKGKAGGEVGSRRGRPQGAMGSKGQGSEYAGARGEGPLVLFLAASIGTATSFALRHHPLPILRRWTIRV